jgi:phosphoenolpyruvate carboxylase
VQPKNLRVFIARSDPALNYGLFCATLLSKIALSKLKNIEEQTGVRVHPIIGVGSKPFRGHLSPENTESFLQEYRGLATVTVQSAFRYDYPLNQVKECIKLLNDNLPNGEPTRIEPSEETLLLGVLQKCRKQYEAVIEFLAPLINRVSSYVPQRRTRKLHIGLFGYSRNVAGVNLPRAIPFSAALYTIGVPPEFFGASVLEDLSDQEWAGLRKHYLKMDHDFRSVGNFVSWENIEMLHENKLKVASVANMSSEKLSAGLKKIESDLRAAEERLNIKLGPQTPTQKRYENFANNFLVAFIEQEEDEAKKALIETAKVRRCLG